MSWSAGADPSVAVAVIAYGDAAAASKPIVPLISPVDPLIVRPSGNPGAL